MDVLIWRGWRVIKSWIIGQQGRSNFILNRTLLGGRAMCE